ncbi:hypothetical protein SESBI_28459 [Sesbania bispinosa]|nr:hypothetical protein SESBI_28459 [Sesbania bispinosa]
MSSARVSLVPDGNAEVLTSQEEEQLDRSKKKHKVDAEPSNSSVVECNGSVPQLGNQTVLFPTTIDIGMERKTISYKDICLGVNGHNICEEDMELFEFEVAQQGDGPGAKGDGDNNDFLGDPLCPVVKLTELEIESIRIPWKHSLLVKLLGKRMGLRYFHARLLKMWRPKGNMEVIDIDNDYFIIRFEDLTNLP